MKRRIHLFTCLLAGILLVISGCDSSDSITRTLGEGETVKVTMLQTTDVHHRASGTGASATYSPTDGKDSSGTDDFTKGGYGRIAARVFAIRDAMDNQDIPTVLVDSGDFLMGTVYDLTLGSTPAAFKFMEEMKYDAITLGNHEFDYGAAGLAQILKTAQGPGGSDFTIPIVATNMVTSDLSDIDNGIEAFVASGMIKNTFVKTLSNGLKVGFIGLMGKSAQADAPLSAPVDFKNDMTDTTPEGDVAFLQAKVDALKAQGVHLVIALSHSGVSKTDPAAPAGDDIDLARKVSGIDIIASGHEHKRTDAVIEIENVTDTSHTTYIICAGKYGENLSQLDITYTEGTGVTAVALVNHGVDDSTPGNFNLNSLVELLDSGLNKVLKAFGLPEINQIIVGSGSDNLSKPDQPGESGMGNLVADSLRYLLKPAVDAGLIPSSLPTVGVVANGVIRNGFALGQGVSFADMYSVLPLGMTVDPAQQSVPGYPLVTVYLTGTDIKNACQVAAYVEAAGDPVFMGALETANPALYGALLNLKPEYYMNLSGVRYSHGGAAGGYQVDSANVALYANSDYQCQGVTTKIDDLVIPAYPVVVDLYVLLMMQSPDFKALLTGLGIPVTPLYNSGTASAPNFVPVPKEADYATILSLRLDSDPEVDGIQETKEWMALLNYLTSSVADFGLSPQIDANFYASDVINGAGNASRVNTP